MKTVIVNDISYKIGQNAKENWELLDLPKDYIWFHLKSFPSCHVIVEKEEPDNNEILEGAKICLENTKYRNLKNIKVNYTKIENIVKADKVGAVTFKSNRKVNTIMI